MIKTSQMKAIAFLTARVYSRKDTKKSFSFVVTHKWCNQRRNNERIHIKLRSAFAYIHLSYLDVQDIYKRKCVFVVFRCKFRRLVNKKTPNWNTLFSAVLTTLLLSLKLSDLKNRCSHFAGLLLAKHGKMIFFRCILLTFFLIHFLYNFWYMRLRAKCRHDYQLGESFI